MNEENTRQMPTSELDLNMMMTDSVWGRPEVSSELKDKLSKYYVTKDKDGKETVTSESLWGLLGFYTRDMRLGNLNMLDGSYQYVTHYIDLAHDLLEAGMIEPFLIALSRAATQLEVSQSKNGFLRRAMNTLRHETITGTTEPPKKTFFGGKKEGSY